VYRARLMMMDKEPARNVSSSTPKINLRISASRLFYYKNSLHFCLSPNTNTATVYWSCLLIASMHKKNNDPDMPGWCQYKWSIHVKNNERLSWIDVWSGDDEASWIRENQQWSTVVTINLMEAIPLCDIIQSYTNIYVNTQLFLF